ncbi:hypothetical protein AXG93_2891s1320 [Marchantia polymorpha subsp. ruderalis]|uniref:Uncharacterized protein n=1 Tax=Marchantia polymorpha subsp. ruderalis TaxID=1480154 RepID=A0A176WLR6_MARPO|nr:hypothetical protein AXG93_2891s1320 [Marchantia polymorpha subsp. ruderalis]
MAANLTRLLRIFAVPDLWMTDERVQNGLIALSLRAIEVSSKKRQDFFLTVAKSPSLSQTLRRCLKTVLASSLGVSFAAAAVLIITCLQEKTSQSESQEVLIASGLYQHVDEKVLEGLSVSPKDEFPLEVVLWVQRNRLGGHAHDDLCMRGLNLEAQLHGPRRCRSPCGPPVELRSFMGALHERQMLGTTAYRPNSQDQHILLSKPFIDRRGSTQAVTEALVAIKRSELTTEAEQKLHNSQEEKVV